MMPNIQCKLHFDGSQGSGVARIFFLCSSCSASVRNFPKAMRTEPLYLSVYLLTFSRVASVVGPNGGGSTSISFSQSMKLPLRCVDEQASRPGAKILRRTSCPQFVLKELFGRISCNSLSYPAHISLPPRT